VFKSEKKKFNKWRFIPMPLLVWTYPATRLAHVLSHGKSPRMLGIPRADVRTSVCFQMMGCGALINAQKSGPDLPIFPLPAIRKPSRL